MILLRTAQKDDLADICQLADQGGVIGITTLPNNIDLLTTRLAWSTASFKKTVTLPGHEYYLFVLEDTNTGKVVGTSAIEASIGVNSPFYSYQVSMQTCVCHALNIQTDYKILNLVNDYHGYTEICTLFLDPVYRKHNNGLLLSRARFLFMANHPRRFSNTIIAEMRGLSDEAGRSPFWEHIGAHFFQMSFATADRLTLSTDKQFIADLMPKNSIYVNLLHPEAQAVIGIPHPSSQPAMNILNREGFHYNHYIDIFDAGPTIEAPRDQIRTSAQSQVLVFKNRRDAISGPLFIIGTTTLDYRATIGPVEINPQEGTCSLTPDIAALLQVNSLDKLRISPLLMDQ